MKIAILVAGYSKYFPLFIDKPKCLYHLNGQIQLQRVIEDAKQFVSEKDIIIVAGYKHSYIEKFVKKHYPEIEVRVNERYTQPAIYSFRKAIENVDDDIVFMFGDESISRKNVERIAHSNKKMAILYHDTFYYYSVGILKLRKDMLPLINDDKYLTVDFLKDIYRFSNNGKEYDYSFSINSGICIGYMIIDFVRTIGKIQKIEHPSTYTGSDIDFLHFDPKTEYLPDLDYITDTDEYKNSFLLRFYSDFISRALKKVLRLCRISL